MKQIKALKSELKVHASTIRELKAKRKESKYGYVSGLSREQEHYRFKHIAYCLLRGRTIEEIENKLRDPKDPNHKWVRDKANKLFQTLEEEIKREQALCVSETGLA
jgi:hypothetical protein